ncbi:MAG: hypothetical protein NVV82_02870 [Sporocytophaga sp.]|nr:hypothetical protein [Sporocytophaga sp.]
MIDVKTFICFFIFSLCASIAIGQSNKNLPSDSRIHKDLNAFFRKYYSEEFLDSKVYQIKGLDMVAFDYKSEDTLRPDQISIQKFPGSFIDTINRECLVLISPADTYPLGPIWGVPYAMLFLYKYQNNQWKLKYAENFFGRLELKTLNKNSRLNQIYVNIDYCNQGQCQWLASVFHFKNNKLTELYNAKSYNDLMFLAAQVDAKEKDFTLPSQGDTIGVENHLETIKDIDGDNINEFIVTESITLFNSLKDNELYFEGVTRKKVYTFKNAGFQLKEVTPFTRKIYKN